MDFDVKGYIAIPANMTISGIKINNGDTFVKNDGNHLPKTMFNIYKNIADCFIYSNFNRFVAVIEVIGQKESESEKTISVTGIEIIRELSSGEILEAVNNGKGNTGIDNTGDMNAGSYNRGNSNSGEENLGNCNVGIRNVGSRNSGSTNLGSHNSDFGNIGNYNSGSYNFKDCNAGSYNVGNKNAGSYNVGNYNSGDWNLTNYSTGFFNITERPIYLFDQPTSLSAAEIANLPGMKVLNSNFQMSEWTYSYKMTDKEKSDHPDYKITGGYLKPLSYKAACQRMWDKLTGEEKQKVMEIPNFDAQIFQKITGIDVSK